MVIGAVYAVSSVAYAAEGGAAAVAAEKGSAVRKDTAVKKGSKGLRASGTDAAESGILLRSERAETASASLRGEISTASSRRQDLSDLRENAVKKISRGLYRGIFLFIF